jgi:hypothetical protein
MSAAVLYVLVLFSAVAHSIWNSLVKSAGDRVLTMVMIRGTGLVLGLAIPICRLAPSRKLEVAAAYGLGDVPIAVELRRADVAGLNVTRPS